MSARSIPAATRASSGNQCMMHCSCTCKKRAAVEIRVCVASGFARLGSVAKTVTFAVSLCVTLVVRRTWDCSDVGRRLLDAVVVKHLILGTFLSSSQITAAV